MDEQTTPDTTNAQTAQNTSDTTDGGRKKGGVLRIVLLFAAALRNAYPSTNATTERSIRICARDLQHIRRKK